MHEHGYLESAEEVALTPKDCGLIKKLIDETDSKTIFDFGSGKGRQYEEFKRHELFNINRENIRCYDPGVKQYATIPEGTFDGVISTDVFEHIPEDELDESFDLLFSKADKFAYIAIHCGLASASLPDGKNAHCTLKHPKEWNRIINKHNVKNIKIITMFRIPVNPIYDVLKLVNRN